MTSRTPANARPVKQGRWLLTLFALPFAAVGVGLLLLSVLPTLYDWARMQSWQPVQATLQSTTLNSHSGKSRTYSVSARYRFQFAGREVEGQRVAISGGADNMGDFQQNLGARLEQARAQGLPVTAWVNPADPSESVLDRSLRWGLLTFKVLFALLFGGFGVGLLVFTWRGHTGASASDAAQPRPWLARREWAANQIRSNHRLQTRFIGGFAIAWNLVTLPMAAAHLPEQWREGDRVAVAALVAFVAVGLALLVWALRALRDARRFGDVRLQLDPFPGAIGGDFGASLALPTVAYDGDRRFTVLLRCSRHDRIRTGANNGSAARETTVWQAEGVAQAEPHGAGTRLRWRFPVPRHLPASESPANAYHAWQLQVRCTEGGLGFERSFDVPVYATGAAARTPQPDAAQHPALRQLRAAQVEDISDMESIAGGVRLRQPYGRAWQQKLPLALLGAVIGGLALFLDFEGAPLPFLLVLGGTGATLLCIGLFGLANSRRMELGTRGLRTERRFLGLMLSWHQAPPQNIARLQLKESYTTQAGTRSTTFYCVQVLLKNGRAITVADSLRGRAAAEHLVRALAAGTGYAA